MRLIMHQRQDIESPEVTLEYNELTESVKRVSDFVRTVDKSLLCRKDKDEYSVPVSDIYYVESVDKKTFVYCKEEVYQSANKLFEVEEMLHGAGFVRVSKSVLLNIETLKSVKNLANSKLEAILSNGEKICVSRKYLKDIREVLIRRNEG